MAAKHLRDIAGGDESISIVDVDILKDPKRAWRDGIRMIPALRVNESIKSGIFLTRDAIEAFIASNKP